jgi:hypothetical protein
MADLPKLPAAADRCPRCGSSFHCGAHDAAPCACSTIKLTPELLAELRQRYNSCLCLACLADVAAGGPMVLAAPDFRSP